MTQFLNVQLKTLHATFAIFITLDFLMVNVISEHGGKLIFPRAPSAEATGGNSCRTPNGRPGDCIIVSRCRHLWNNRNYRLLRESLCGFMGDVPKVCCPRSALASTTSSTTRSPTLIDIINPITTTKAPRIPLVGSFSQLNDSTNQRQTAKSEFSVSTPRTGRIPVNNEREDKPFLPKECGKNKVTFRRIVGGQESGIGTWPWMAAIYITRRGIKSAECGGALITEKYVISAAHCVVNSRRGTVLDPKMLTVRLGDHDLESDDDGAEPVERSVTSIIKHNLFDLRTFQNDICIIQLSSPVRFVNHVAPICLPFGESLQGDASADRNAFAAGWGSTSFNGPASSKLLEVQLRIWKNEDCEERFRREVPITKVNLCAGDGDKDSCRGDSGGPLMLPQMDGRFYIVGIVSFGKKCAEPGYPGVYTRVSEFLNWIEEKIKPVV